MKLIIIPALFVSLFALHPVYAVGAYDLQYMLDHGEQMTLSHASNTVYISFEKPGGDFEEIGYSRPPAKPVVAKAQQRFGQQKAQ
ncbi:hypothetical protein [Edwardsiella tarda]|uniref:hypothetical protein n=1 Tax=Edwardsiella tarda TaxID=636 RepID=UPI003081748D|nr:hypothetical protein GBS0709_03790 [Edwardsiella tarda]